MRSDWPFTRFIEPDAAGGAHLKKEGSSQLVFCGVQLPCPNPDMLPKLVFSYEIFPA